MDKDSAIITVKDHFNYNEEVMNEILQDIEAFNRKWCFFEFISSKVNLIREINYKKVKIGEKIRIDCPEWKFHGMEAVVDKKRFGQLECYIPNDATIRLKLTPSSIRFLPQEKKEKISYKVGDLVLVTEARFRPRYEAGDIFKIVWKGAKYVRVVPRNPKGKLLIDHFHASKKPGDNIREYADLEGRKVYRECVYSMDIPHDKLPPVKEYYGEEMGGLLGDLDGIGF
jgi:hypothetical protein